MVEQIMTIQVKCIWKFRTTRLSSIYRIDKHNETQRSDIYSNRYGQLGLDKVHEDRGPQLGLGH